MKKCPQTETQSVLEHGFSVKNYTFDILNHLRYNTPLKYKWRIPEWLYIYKDEILANIHNDDILKQYTILHDCGKPYCLEYDDDGKRHYPKHSEVSYHTYMKLYNNDVVGDLIRHDMDIHLLRSDSTQAFVENTNTQNIFTHLLVGLAEIHSNAEMFGGIDSTSFKIKWKNINKRGEQIIYLLYCRKQN